jgi:putative transposase
LADLRADGEAVSRKTVAGSLRRQGLAGISPRTFAPATTVVDPDAGVPKDLVERAFDTGELDRVWTSDITYLRTGEGWLYLCAVRDGCSRRVIGWAVDDHMRTDLVESAVAMAVTMRGELADRVDPARRPWLPVHLHAAGAVRPQAQSGPLGRAYRGVLG